MYITTKVYDYIKKLIDTIGLTKSPTNDYELTHEIVFI